MATLSVRKNSFQQNLFLSVGTLFIIFVLFFCLYQYNREKESRVDIMHSRMQMYNYTMAQTLGDSLTNKNVFCHYVSTHHIEGMRVTLIDEKGNVLIDSEQKGLPLQLTESHKATVEKDPLFPNHLHRTEVQVIGK